MHDLVTAPDTTDPALALRAAVATIMATMHVARDLIKSNRPVDLSGLDSQVGLICAKALDLPADHRSAIRAELAVMLQAAESLHNTLIRAGCAISHRP